MRDQTTWNKIRPGDIISFRYPTKGVLKLNTLLVFAIKAPVQTKSGSKKHLRGMKIEERNRPFITPTWIREVTKVGNLSLIKKTSNNEAIFDNIAIYEGIYITQTFTVNSFDPDQRFILDNSGIDLSTLSRR